jgi:hypothetical protein
LRGRLREGDPGAGEQGGSDATRRTSTDDDDGMGEQGRRRGWSGDGLKARVRSKCSVHIFVFSRKPHYVAVTAMARGRGTGCTCARAAKRPYAI